MIQSDRIRHSGVGEWVRRSPANAALIDSRSRVPIDELPDLAESLELLLTYQLSDRDARYVRNANRQFQRQPTFLTLELRHLPALWIANLLSQGHEREPSTYAPHSQPLRTAELGSSHDAR